MRIRDFRADDSPQIDLVPLIDVVLCLLVFFVVTTTFESRSVLNLQLPRAQGETAQTETTVLDVLVNADGRYFVGDREALRTDLESLKRTIVEVAGDERERLEDAGRHLVHRMELYLNSLGTIAAAGPLLGLFGTVVGMIQMFMGILDHGVGDVNQLAGGIGKALVCTATGMIVAIPALMFHRYFRGRIAGYIVDMEHEAAQLLDTLDPGR